MPVGGRFRRRPQNCRAVAASATIPSYCADHQPPIVLPAPSLANSRTYFALWNHFLPRFNLDLQYAAPQQDELRHNCQLLGNGTALYGCRGTRLKRQLRPITDAGLPIAMSSI